MRSDVGNQGGSYIRVLQVLTPDPVESDATRFETYWMQIQADVLQFGDLAEGTLLFNLLVVVTPDTAERIRRHDSTTTTEWAHADVLQFGERERSNLTWPLLRSLLFNLLQHLNGARSGVVRIVLAPLLPNLLRPLTIRQLTRANPYRRRREGYVLTLGCPDSWSRNPDKRRSGAERGTMNQLSVQRPVGNGFEPRRVMRSGVTLDMCTWGRGVNKLARFHLGLSLLRIALIALRSVIDCSPAAGATCAPETNGPPQDLFAIADGENSFEQLTASTYWDVSVHLRLRVVTSHYFRRREVGMWRPRIAQGLS
ncbi:hypothetical protein Bbelb_321190 [Branchiostoma belcheri]|nr:hypothetical protein Bbelb_321190 [Branchiostoma belcheri]